MPSTLLTPAVRERLRYVTLANPNLSLDRFPDFLIVGPQRTGTTWLHAHLRYHPQIFLSEPKELFFFSSVKDRSSKRFQSSDLGWYLQFFREPLWRFALKTSICLRRHRELYRPTVRGEATASYAVLDRDVIADIIALNPDIRVILMVRNPIERAWSHAKKDLVRNRKRKFTEVAEHEFHDFFADPYQRQCARYVESYDNWAAHLRADHLFVGLFDDIATRPEAMLLESMSFLGVRSERKYIDASVRNPINPAGGEGVPPHYRALLQELLQPEIDQLRGRFGWSWPATGGAVERTNRVAGAAWPHLAIARSFQ